MMLKLQVTDKDRLLAAGLMSLLTLLLLPYINRLEKFSLSNYILIISAIFAAGAFVFSLSPLGRGSPVQKILALLFLIPAFLFFITALSHWGG